jgi:HD-like signal output (HDOD) protein
MDKNVFEYHPDRTQEILDRAKELLPPAPPVAFKLLSLLRNPSTQANDEVLEIIQFDTNLTAQVLKSCNTAVVRGSEPISSLDDAVNRLGYQRILEIVMAICFGKYFQKRKCYHGIDPYALWRHSIASALASRYLAYHSKSTKFSLQTAFTATLLHDFGKVILNLIEIPEMDLIRPLMIEKGFSCSEAEMEVLGTDHAEVAGLLMKEWDLPPEIYQGIRDHNHPEDDETGYADLIYLSSQCATAIFSGTNWADYIQTVQVTVPSRIGLSHELIAKCLDPVSKDASAIEAYLMVA